MTIIPALLRYHRVVLRIECDALGRSPLKIRVAVDALLALCGLRAGRGWIRAGVGEKNAIVQADLACEHDIE